MENDKLYQEHILDAILRIEKFKIGFLFETFVKDEKTVSATMRELGVIGEAAKKLSDEFNLKKSSKHSFPWREIAGIRDKLVHDYFEIDVEAVWETIEKDIPFLKRELLFYEQ